MQYIHPNTAQQVLVLSAGFKALSSSLKLNPGGLNYSPTAVLQALT